MDSSAILVSVLLDGPKHAITTPTCLDEVLYFEPDGAPILQNDYTRNELRTASGDQLALRQTVVTSNGIFPTRQNIDENAETDTALHRRFPIQMMAQRHDINLVKGISQCISLVSHLLVVLSAAEGSRASKRAATILRDHNFDDILQNITLMLSAVASAEDYNGHNGPILSNAPKFPFAQTSDLRVAILGALDSALQRHASLLTATGALYDTIRRFHILDQKFYTSTTSVPRDIAENASELGSHQFTQSQYRTLFKLLNQAHQPAVTNLSKIFPSIFMYNSIDRQLSRVGPRREVVPLPQEPVVLRKRRDLPDEGESLAKRLQLIHSKQPLPPRTATAAAALP